MARHMKLRTAKAVMMAESRAVYNDPFHNDPAFLDAFRAGEARALDRVYRAFERPLRNFIVRGFAFHSGGRPLHFGGYLVEHDLQDILQETFRRAFGVKARQSYDGVRPFKNYLFTIARNAVITDITHRQRQIPVGEAVHCDAPSEEMSTLESWVASQRPLFSDPQPPSSHEQMEHLEVFALLAGFIEFLSEEDARFFHHRFLDGLSQESTARQMGWNRARVRKREERLRRAFLVHVQGSGYLEARSESRKVRRIGDPEALKARVDRSRMIYRAWRAWQNHDFIFQAA